MLRFIGLILFSLDLFANSVHFHQKFKTGEQATDLYLAYNKKDAHELKNLIQAHLKTVLEIQDCKNISIHSSQKIELGLNTSNVLISIASLGVLPFFFNDRGFFRRLHLTVDAECPKSFEIAFRKDLEITQIFGNIGNLKRGFLYTVNFIKHQDKNSSSVQTNTYRFYQDYLISSLPRPTEGIHKLQQVFKTAETLYHEYLNTEGGLYVSRDTAEAYKLKALYPKHFRKILEENHCTNIETSAKFYIGKTTRAGLIAAIATVGIMPLLYKLYGEKSGIERDTEVQYSAICPEAIFAIVPSRNHKLTREFKNDDKLGFHYNVIDRNGVTIKAYDFLDDDRAIEK